MPADFRHFIKHCENCGKPLILNNTRDIQRKRFCSKSCLFAVINPLQFVPPVSEVAREKMRQSKLSLIAKGWKPVGWHAFLPRLRISKRDGYKFIGARREHRVLAEKMIGRAILRGEVVHHVDGNRLNNSIDNLAVLSRSEHQKYHLDLRRFALCHRRTLKRV